MNTHGPGRSQTMELLYFLHFGVHKISLKNLNVLLSTLNPLLINVMYTVKSQGAGP